VLNLEAIPEANAKHLGSNVQISKNGQKRRNYGEKRVCFFELEIHNHQLPPSRAKCGRLNDCPAQISRTARPKDETKKKTQNQKAERTQEVIDSIRFSLKKRADLPPFFALWPRFAGRFPGPRRCPKIKCQKTNKSGFQRRSIRVFAWVSHC
jgi:hypothetical protein